VAKLIVFSVYDSKVTEYTSPFFVKHRGEAMRMWSDIVNDGQSAICRHPEDFSLMELGEWDTNTGVFTGKDAPTNFGLATQSKRQPSSPSPLFDAMKGAVR